ncbi:peptidylprolyl isomerase [Omnitrophica bacterium]|nr:peptidylprolyl isomerase [Candidatus Omnitrophota bacterium]
MKKNIWLIIFFVIAISVTGCGLQKGAKGKGQVLAKIGRDVITINDFNERLEKLPANIRMIAENNKAAYLENLVVETLLYNDAIKKKLNEEEEVALLFEEAKKRILIARLAQDEIENKIKIDEEDMKAYYEENMVEMESPEMFRASHILVDTMEEAAEIADRLNAGGIFEELARKHSKDVTNKRGGDIGYFSAGEMLPEFEDACIKLKIGETSGPVKTQFGYHIIKLTDKRGPEPMKFDQVKDRIERILLTQKRGRLLEDLVNRLKAETKVTINSELLTEANEGPEGIPARSAGGPIGVESFKE